jgi:hypothetical protein
MRAFSRIKNGLTFRDDPKSVRLWETSVMNPDAFRPFIAAKINLSTP